MDRRKPILSNRYEIATDATLREASAKHGARIYAKVRIADALDINSSGLTKDEYSYALKAHFDFVASRDNRPAAFAVEFDGHLHQKDPRVMRRDQLKNSICHKLGMPLLRIDEGYFRRIGRFSVLGWLVEVFFLDEDFCAAQLRGEIPADEPFCWFGIVGLDGQRVVFEYDPFLPYRAHVMKSHDEGICQCPPDLLRGRDSENYVVVFALLSVGDDQTIIGKGRCRSFSFPPVCSFELSEELAIVDLSEKLQLFKQGKFRPFDTAEVGLLREQVAKWNFR